MAKTRWRLACLLDSLGYLEGDGTSLGFHGASISVAEGLRRFARRPEIGAMELYIDPSALANPALLKEAVSGFLPPERQGVGFLSVFPINAIPEVWADGRQRILFSKDVSQICKDRYFRDTFAAGPMPICWDIHTAAGYGFAWEMATASGLYRVPGDCVFSISPSVGRSIDLLFQTHILPGGPGFPGRIEVLPRPVDLEKFRPASGEEKLAARRALGLPEDGHLALFLSRVSAHVKADLLPLIDCFAARAPRDWRLAIIGPDYGGYSQALADRAKAMGLEDRILVRPAIPPENRSQGFAAADLFLFPGDSTVEAFANVVAEAMATGLPVVASDWDGYRPLIVDGETGFKARTCWMPGLERIEEVSPGLSFETLMLMQAQCVWVDMDEFGDAMARLMTSPAECERMGRNARAKAEAELSEDQWMERACALWEEMWSEASQESSEARAGRRAAAARAALPVRITDYLAHNATEIAPMSARLVLTPRGSDVLAGREKPAFYDDSLAFVYGEAMAMALRLAAENRSLGEARDDLAANLRIGPSHAMLQIALLLKRGCLRLSF